MAKLVSVVLAALVAVVSVSAQHPQAVCAWHWLDFNTKSGLTPCDLVGLLAGNGVKPDNSPVPPLIEDGIERYSVPTAEKANSLTCSHVYYNLVSGCAACQGDDFSWATWTEWTANCPAKYGIASVESLISGFATPFDVQAWALIPPAVTNNTFNRAAALAIATSGMKDTSFVERQLAVPTASPSPGSQSMTSVSRSTLIGAVVGGILGTILLSLIGTFVALHRSKVERDRAVAAAHAAAAFGRRQSAGSSVADEKGGKVFMG